MQVLLKHRQLIVPNCFAVDGLEHPPPLPPVLAPAGHPGPRCARAREAAGVPAPAHGRAPVAAVHGGAGRGGGGGAPRLQVVEEVDTGGPRHQQQDRRHLN